jgi:(5-formylfuran-3-yl)methyl phosphate synthase
LMVDGLSTWDARLADGSASVSRAQKSPRLLVSVRDADEARAALAGGADIIDVKEPNRGALGMADPAVIAEIVTCVHGRAPVSAALGELREWTADEGSRSRSEGLSSALSGLSFVKMGLAGCRGQRRWVEDWLQLRGDIEACAGQALPWVAVAYADARQAAAPSVEKVIDAAATTACRGVLLDTHDKQSGSLTELCSTIELQRFADTARAAGLFIAFAGRLRDEHLDGPQLRCADVVGVRSAACRGGDRQQRVAAEQVAALRRSLDDGRSSMVQIPSTIAYQPFPPPARPASPLRDRAACGGRDG